MVLKAHFESQDYGVLTFLTLSANRMPANDKVKFAEGRKEVTEGGREGERKQENNNKKGGG